jgi:hypothetical protein
LPVNSGRQPPRLFERVHFAVENRAAALDSPVVSATDDLALMNQNRSDRNSPLGEPCFSFGDGCRHVRVHCRLHENLSACFSNFFWNVIRLGLNNAPDPRVARLALKAALRAVELSKGENVAHLDTLAEAQYRTGDAEGAIATEEKALKRLEAEIKDRSHPYFKQFSASLDRFRKAALAKADRR